MQRGYTLLELALALVVAGVCLAIALPRLATIRDTLEVEEAALRIVSAHRRARITAILQSRPMVLSVGPTTLRITPATGGSPVWSSSGPAAAGVAFGGAGRDLTYSPVGITTGLSNASFRLSRGSALRTVVVSRLGRARIVRGGP